MTDSENFSDCQINLSTFYLLISFKILIVIEFSLGYRPFGVSLLYMGWDRRLGFQLYQSDPSGNYSGWKATCIGNNSVVCELSLVLSFMVLKLMMPITEFFQSSVESFLRDSFSYW